MAPLKNSLNLSQVTFNFKVPWSSWYSFYYFGGVEAEQIMS